MSDKSKDDDQDKVAVTLPGTVKKVIPPIHPSLPEKAEISHIEDSGRECTKR